jgi:xanthosine utilization system XapX-like protein
MHPETLIADVGLGLIGGYVGTKVMEPVAMQMYEWESAEDRQREDAVRPGPPYEIAARKTTRLLGLNLSDQHVTRLGTTLFHYGLGMSWGPVYALVRRRTDLSPVVAGLGTGAAMSLIVDEGLTPLLGFSAPNHAYPLVTHVRGVVAHLAFGLGVAATVETLRWLGRRAGS